LASDQLEAFVRQEQDRGVEHSPRARNSNVRSPCWLPRPSAERSAGRFAGCESSTGFTSNARWSPRTPYRDHPL